MNNKSHTHTININWHTHIQLEPQRERNGKTGNYHQVGTQQWKNIEENPHQASFEEKTFDHYKANSRLIRRRAKAEPKPERDPMTTSTKTKFDIVMAGWSSFPYTRVTSRPKKRSRKRDDLQRLSNWARQTKRTKHSKEEATKEWAQNRRRRRNRRSERDSLNRCLSRSLSCSSLSVPLLGSLDCLTAQDSLSLSLLSASQASVWECWRIWNSHLSCAISTTTRFVSCSSSRRVAASCRFFSEFSDCGLILILPTYIWLLPRESSEAVCCVCK